jgi:hypothetical protein
MENFENFGRLQDVLQPKLIELRGVSKYGAEDNTVLQKTNETDRRSSNICVSEKAVSQTTTRWLDLDPFLLQLRDPHTYAFHYHKSDADMNLIIMQC